MSLAGEQRLSPTQLCVINALHGDPVETQRRMSRAMPLDQQSANILANYGALPPSVFYHCQEKGRNKRVFVWKNLAGVSVGVLCLLVAYDSLFYVQSSVNSMSGLGSLSLAVDYGAQVLSSLFVPAALMRKLGCKWTLVVSMLGVILYLAANFYPRFETLIPTAVVMGIGFASMWATMNTFVSDLAFHYARVTDSSPTVMVSRFFGIFYMTIQTAKIWGNLISSQILSRREVLYPNVSQLAICGRRYCNQPLSFYEVSSNRTEQVMVSNGTDLEANNLGGTTPAQVATLCGVSVGVALLAVLVVAAALDSIRQKTLLVRTHFLSTLQFLGNRRLMLLSVFTVDSGLVQSFFVGDFTKAFITCSQGVRAVGLVSTCYGIFAVAGSISVGYLAECVGRVTLLVLAVLLNTAGLVFMLFWIPDPNVVFVHYVVASVWGLALSIWLTQLSALYADVFKDRHEEAFSTNRMLECIGFCIGFAWEFFLCMTIKIYVTLALLLVGLIGYVIVEISLWKTRQNSNDSASEI